MGFPWLGGDRKAVGVEGVVRRRVRVESISPVPAVGGGKREVREWREVRDVGMLRFVLEASPGVVGWWRTASFRQRWLW